MVVEKVKFNPEVLKKFDTDQVHSNLEGAKEKLRKRKTNLNDKIQFQQKRGPRSTAFSAMSGFSTMSSTNFLNLMQMPGGNGNFLGEAINSKIQQENVQQVTNLDGKEEMSNLI